MAFDGFVTKSIIAEFNNIIGAKINKIFQPDKNTIILGLYLNRQNYLLNICIDAHNCRIHLTKHSKPNPLVAPNFCMLLRKHLVYGKITNIYMLGLERIVYIDVETINEFNEIETKRIIIELMGKHSNIILLDKNNKIIDSLRHISNCSGNSYRDILPSKEYKLPISNKDDFLSLQNYNEFYLKIKDKDTDLSKAISNSFTGFSLSFVQYAINVCGINAQKLYEYFCNVLKNIGTSKLKFETIYKNNKINDYVLTLNCSSRNKSLNYYLDDFYYERETAENFANYKNNILKIVSEVQKKYINRLQNINLKLKDCSDMDTYKLYGELITANLYKINSNHLNYIELENYYDNNSIIKIPLDIKFSPSINAKHYFKKYSKLKNALAIVTQQKNETIIELQYIDSIIYEIDSCTNIDDLQFIHDEISENILFKKKIHKNKKNKNQNPKKKKNISSFSPIEYEIDNFKIYVGKNNRENDWLTFSFANKNDIWFHTKDIQGSHVILKDNPLINENILVKCAEIAAKHSKAKDSSNVPVDFCKVKFVKKPKLAKPGMVIFSNNKTLNVNPK